MNNNRPIKILLADDDPDDTYFFEKALDEINVNTSLISANNGEELMKYLNKSSELPDLIFLDLNMPRKTGNVCLEEIKSEEKLRHIPVVIYSTSYISQVADVLYKLGANYYLQKCDFSELPEKIERIISRITNNPAQPQRNKFVIEERKELSPRRR